MQQTALRGSISHLIEHAGLAGQPAIRVEATPAETALSPYTSKFGGTPFTPAGFVWPVNPSGQPMHFVGQVNFAEVLAQAPSFLADNYQCLVTKGGIARPGRQARRLEEWTSAPRLAYVRRPGGRMPTGCRPRSPRYLKKGAKV